MPSFIYNDQQNRFCWFTFWTLTVLHGLNYLLSTSMQIKMSIFYCLVFWILIYCFFFVFHLSFKRNKTDESICDEPTRGCAKTREHWRIGCLGWLADYLLPPPSSSMPEPILKRYFLTAAKICVYKAEETSYRSWCGRNKRVLLSGFSYIFMLSPKHVCALIY